MILTRGRLRIHYTDTGHGDPIVLAHGFLMDGTMFDRTRDALVADGRRIITVDARGFGATESDPTEQFTYWDLADDLAAVIDHLGIVDPVTVGGMSQGGYIALRFALRYPQRTAALVLASTMARAATPSEAAQYRSMAADWINPGIELEPLARALAQVLVGGTAEDQEYWVRRWLTQDRAATAAAWEALAARDDITAQLGRCVHPALILRGHADHAGGPAEEASALAQALPGAAALSAVVAGETAGHGVWWTHPAPVSTMLTTFLNRAAA